MEKIEHTPIFFIVGRPRSGTTLLRTLFDAHPNVNIPLECKYILDLYPKYGKKKNWSKSDLEEFLTDLDQQWRFDLWTLDREKLAGDLLSCEGESSYGRICKMVHANYKSFFDKEEILLIGDKNPGYTIYTRRLLKIFPEARFIHIVRDYRDNYLSVKDVDFELPIVSLVVTKWKLFYRKFRKDGLKKPSAYTVVRYEDLVGDPEREMKRLCEFIGLEYKPEVFNFHMKQEDVLKTYPKEFVTRYHANLLNKVNKSRSGVWKTKLTPREVRLADQTACRLSEKAGYERQFRGFSPWLFFLSLPGILLAYSLAGMTKVVDKLPYKVRMNILNRGPIAVARAFLRVFNPKKLK